MYIKKKSIFPSKPMMIATSVAAVTTGREIVPMIVTADAAHAGEGEKEMEILNGFD